MKIYLFCYKNSEYDDIEKNAFIANKVILDHETMQTLMKIPIYEEIDLELEVWKIE